MANAVAVSKNRWMGGKAPLDARYGKLMMWFFLVSDAFSFSALLIVYGVARFRAADSGIEWADPEEVFRHLPIIEGNFPLIFVGIMTFILIASSVTMVLAVEAGHRMDQKAVIKWMWWTVVGGIAFLSCQAFEWYHFIYGDGIAERVVNVNNTLYEIGYPGNGFLDFDGTRVWLSQYTEASQFPQLFFFITGFHGTHVLSGVILNIVILGNTYKGTYEKRGHYEMVEKVGLYWHFVDLVWVFVFTFFYLV